MPSASPSLLTARAISGERLGPDSQRSQAPLAGGREQTHGCHQGLRGSCGGAACATAVALGARIGKPIRRADCSPAGLSVLDLDRGRARTGSLGSRRIDPEVRASSLVSLLARRVCVPCDCTRPLVGEAPAFVTGMSPAHRSAFAWNMPATNSCNGLRRAPWRCHADRVRDRARDCGQDVAGVHDCLLGEPLETANAHDHRCGLRAS
jgi:hypothetical protein